MDLTTVSNDHAVIFDGGEVRRYDGLESDRDYEFDGLSFRTLPAKGELLSRFATVNDLHFGETECGVLEGLELGPIFSSAPDEPPYPETMNRAAIADMEAIDPMVVIAKGDLTANGTDDEYQQFLDAYGPAFGDRLFHVRGNHDAYHGATFGSQAPYSIDLPGVRLAIIDTTIPGSTPGQITNDTIEWLGDISNASDRPVLVFGHHHTWSLDSETRPDGYFGINPETSEHIAVLFALIPQLMGYFAGHSHRNRCRRYPVTGNVPWAQVACVKDYPGGWAEYRVFEDVILQVFHRISSPEALAWTEKTRQMYGGTYHDYAFGDLSDRCFVVAP